MSARTDRVLDLWATYEDARGSTRAALDRYREGRRTLSTPERRALDRDIRNRGGAPPRTPRKPKADPYIEVQHDDPSLEGRHWGTGGGADGWWLSAWSRADAVESSAKLRAAGVRHAVVAPGPRPLWGTPSGEDNLERMLCFFTPGDYLRGAEALGVEVDPQERALIEEDEREWVERATRVEFADDSDLLVVDPGARVHPADPGAGAAG